MKYVILLGDGMADFPIEVLGGKPFGVCPHPIHGSDGAEGTLGLIDTIPQGLPPEAMWPIWRSWL